MFKKVHRREVAWGMVRELEGTFLTRGGKGGENPAGAQCTNVPNSYWERFGLDPLYGDAIEWIGADAAALEWISLPSLCRLTVGDVAVFLPAESSDRGHVDLVVNVRSGSYVGLDQGWPLGAPVERVQHHRGQLAGLLRMR